MTRTGRLMRYLVGLGLVILVVTLVISRRKHKKETEAPAVVAAEVATVMVTTFVVTLAAIGTVEPRPGFSAELSAPDATRVQRVYVALGDRVSSGQALVQLDTSVWAARRHEARVALATAQQAYDRARRLLAEGAGPRKDVEQAASGLARAHADLEAAQRLVTLGTLRSPIDGVVIKLNAPLSAPVDKGQLVIEVVDPRGLEVLFHISVTDAARIRRGAAVLLSSGEDQQRTVVGRGTIAAVSAAVDSTGTVAVRATVPTPNRPLKVGEALSGRIDIQEHENAVVVPLDALVPVDDRVQVFVVDARNVAHATPVRVANRGETEAEIASGLKGGERVVTKGAYGVTDGATIQIRSAQ